MSNGQLILARAEENFGFVTADELAVIANDPATRLTQMIVRWNQGRAKVAAQDVAGLIAATCAGGWDLRDVSVAS